jgi:hypothetical protein
MGDLFLDILLTLIYMIYIGTIAVVIVFPPVFLWAIICTKKRRGIQNQIVKDNAERLKGGHWIRVNYASETRLRRPTRKEFWQSWAWEATGILLLTDAEVVFIGKSVYSPSRYALAFSPKNTTVSWPSVVKPRPLTPLKRLLTFNTGSLHWLGIECDGRKHYFISETGPFVRASIRRDWEIYDELCRVLPPGCSTPS